MDGMSFDYDQYFSEETFVIDDFGEICEDIVRIASATSHYLCKDFDSNELRHDSPPPGSFIAANRSFEKEVPSLFSEMEYLTEVSPETDAAVHDQKPVTIAVNPSEFSGKPRHLPSPKPHIDGFVEESPPDQPDSDMESLPIAGKPPEKPAHDTTVIGCLTDPTDYQRILNNYIQKGRRKLEASSYSKMKASHLAREKMNANSAASIVETVTIPSLLCRPQGTTLSAVSFAASSKLPGRCITNTATVNLHLLDTLLPLTADSTQVQEKERARPISVSPTISRNSPHRPAVISSRPSRAYRCQDCSVSFPSSELLRKHTCIIAEQYQCHLCLREFKKRKTLDHHMKSHDKVFSTDDDLRK